MSPLILFFLVLVLGYVCSQESSTETNEVEEPHPDQEFNYDRQGADWTGTCRQGKQQSPIDLADYYITDKPIAPLRFSFYDREQNGPITIINNGNTAQFELVRIAGKPISYVDGGMMTGIYEPISVHFHWGSSNSKGSEHTINDEHFDVEMHIVHKNIDYFDKTVGEASRFSDGLAVLAVMIQAAPAPESPKQGLYKVFDALNKITQYQSNITIKGDFTLTQLMHNINTDEFYTYRGSLTTPDCAESVIWTVFKDIIQIPQSEISKLWGLEDARKRPLINNYRELQATNGRRIFYRSPEAAEGNSIGPAIANALTNLVVNVISPLSARYL